MRNFEMPKMNISTFAIENIVTVSSYATTNEQAALDALSEKGVNTNTESSALWKFTY